MWLQLVQVGRTLIAAVLFSGTVTVMVVGVVHAGSDTIDCATHEVSASTTPDAAREATPTSPACEMPPLDITLSPPPAVTSGPTLSPQAASMIEVAAWDLFFDPTEIHLPASGPSEIVLTNHGYANHNLTIDELGVELLAGRGRRDAITLDGIPPGTYTFYCSVSGHRLAGMEGTLVVE